MIRALALYVVLASAVLAALYQFVEKPALEADLHGGLCTNGRITWECAR